MYNQLEEFEKLAKDNCITVVYYDCSQKPLKAFIVIVDEQYFVCIDSNAPIEEKKYMLAYELAHYFTNTFYNVNDSEKVRIEKENIANAYMRKELLGIMKNRAMLLCIKHEIQTVEEYALKIGVSTSRADDIIHEKVILSQEEIDANCRLFNVSADYFLALTEK